MAYSFEPHETVSDGIRRIAKEQLGAARAELSETGPGDDERVHSVRKRTKKLRGLLRLIRPALGTPAYRLENTTLRDAAQTLASAREAAAVLTSFDRLVQHYAERVAPGAFAALRADLVRDKQATTQGTAPEHAAAQAALQQVWQRVDDWPLSADGWKLLGPGLSETYARGRAALATAYAEETTEAFHEWRKRTKHHWYHVRLLTPLWPAPLAGLEVELHRLSELLGDEHDLADLARLLAAGPTERLERSDTAALLSLLELRRQQLRVEARSLGARVFAEPPKRLARRFRAYFEAWRSEAATFEPTSTTGEPAPTVQPAGADAASLPSRPEKARAAAGTAAGKRANSESEAGLRRTRPRRR